MIAIIGILIGLLLPAIGAIRDRARFTTCSNKIRQLSLANINFESANMHFPTGQVGPSDNNKDGMVDFQENQQLGHIWFILPFLEQSHYSRQFEIQHESLSLGGPAWFSNESNFQASFQELPALRCPSESFGNQKSLHVSRFKLSGRGISDAYIDVDETYAGWTSYLGASGRVTTSAKNEGIFLQRLESTYSEIVDGSSNTILIGESLGSVASQGSELKLFAKVSIFSSGVDNKNVFFQTLFSSRPPPIFSSSHFGGTLVNFSFADGHTTGIPSTTELEILSSLFTKMGGEQVDY